jgi:hypothetical protein
MGYPVGILDTSLPYSSTKESAAMRYEFGGHIEKSADR